jgi:hypothetical protein
VVAIPSPSDFLSSLRRFTMSTENMNAETELANEMIEEMIAEVAGVDEAEQALDAEHAEGEALEAATPKSDEVKEPKTPAWEAFASALQAHAQALGLEWTEQKGFIKVVNASTAQKLYIAKGGKAVKRIDTTLPILGQDGTYPLEKPNGKIECHVVADVDTVKTVLTQLAGTEFGSLRASKRAPAKAETPAV